MYVIFRCSETREVACRAANRAVTSFRFPTTNTLQSDPPST